MAGLVLVSARQPAAVVAVEMWEPAFDAGFQCAEEKVGKSCLGRSTVDPARHLHSEPPDSAHFGEKRPLGTAQEQKRHFPKSRVDWTFLQIVVQNPFFQGGTYAV